MKSLVIFICLLVISTPISFAREVAIPELFEIETTSVVQDEKEVYYYAGSKLIAINDEYKFQDRLNSDTESRSLPFGQTLNKNTRLSFTGKELDEDLYYFNARYYDSNLGKFTSLDPVKDNHPYAYVENNPANLIDPTGMDDMFGTADMMLEYEQSSPEYKAAFKKGFFGGSSTAADFYPVVGDIKGIFDGIRGKDQFGELGWGERALCIFCLSEIKTFSKLRKLPKLVDALSAASHIPLSGAIDAARRFPETRVVRQMFWQGSEIYSSITKRGDSIGIYLTRNLGETNDAAKGMESVINMEIDELGRIELFKYGTNIPEASRAEKTRTIVSELVGTHISDLEHNMRVIGNMGGDLDPKLLSLVQETFAKID